MTLRPKFALTLAAVLLIGSSVFAAPLTSISSGWAGPSSGSGPTITFGPTTSPMTLSGPGGIPTYNAPIQINGGAFTLNLTPYASNPGSVGLPGSFTLTVVNNTAITGSGPNINPTLGGVATFSFEGGGLLTELGSPPNNLASITNTQYWLSSNTTGIDLGPIGLIWDFVMTANGAFDFSTGTPRVSVTGTTSASYSLNATDDFHNGFGDPVPEPASMAVFGILTLAGGVIARRRMAKAAA